MIRLRYILAGAISGALLSGTVASASPDRLKFSIGSMHTKDDEGKFTPFNPGVFAIWDRKKGSVGAGVFRNSYSEGSFAFVGTYPVVTGDRWDLSVFGAFAWYPNGSRFGLSVGNWVPGLGFEFRTERYFAQVFPSSDDIFDAVITVGVSVPLSANK